ncbi:MAG TPA: glycosyltransferase family 2 protein [Arenimonas sp.]|nr:glycosyltransferase family 2 protein [Arenimonas sp.]HPO24570.1 glycosyltransferase family 2 protein [Arenimonas sp.]HPW31483.1 glycosyltransferase family 2 protein [Arenimonas sp.]
MASPVNNNIAVVVVTHESAATIGMCLRRLRRAVGLRRVVVVDNASSDDTCAIVEKILPEDQRISLVRNTENLGFAAACNQGASALSQPWLVFLNPDAYVEPDSLSRLRDSAIEYAGAGLIGVDLVDEKGVADRASRRFDLSLISLLKNHADLDLIYMGRDPDKKVQAVEACSGALMMMPATVFHHVGGFDHGYRLHAEDLDLCRRVRMAGYEVLVDNSVRVIHVRGASGLTKPTWVEWQKHRSLWRYFQKYEAAQTPDWIEPFVWIGLWLHFIWALLRLRLKASPVSSAI